VKVLVTGGSSLVGREVASRLRNRGDEVTLLQRGVGPAGFDHHPADITDAGAVTAAMTGMDAVVHAAARVGIVGRWSEFEAVNVDGTANVIAAAQAERIGRVVYVSSPSVAHAGRSLVGVGAEPADPDSARGHYARSKAMAEQLALDANAPCFAVVAVRPHLIWGPGDKQLVGRIVERARAGRMATIGSGLALIDTTYVTNAADAIIAALDRAPEAGGRAFVVSNGEPRTVTEMVERIVVAAGMEPPRLRVPYPVAWAGGLAVEKAWARARREDDPPMTKFLAEQLATAHWFDQRETRTMLDWRPAVSIDEGFERLRDWYAQNGPDGG